MVNTTKRIWTIGHSNRSSEEFLDLLRAASMERVADVRRFPGSRAHPHFGAGPLAEALQAAGIEYRHFIELGGRRSRAKGDSPNRGWRVEAFNAFADTMATPQFAASLDELIASAEQTRTAIMCAEALPWRCHRRLIADALLIRGWQVQDIMGPGKSTPHLLTPFARVDEGRLTYPAV